MGRKTKLQRVQAAIFEVMGDFIAGSVLTTDELSRACDEVEATDVKISTLEWVKPMVNDCIMRNTFTGEDDPGGWSPNAIAVIHCEDGIDAGYYEPGIMDKWFEVSDKMGDMFCEHHNAAVISVWPS